MTNPLYVIKLGSSTVLEGHVIWKELAELVGRGAEVLVVAGGGEAVCLKYNQMGREMRYLTLKSGERFRYCPPEEMPHILAAYEEILLPTLQRRLVESGLVPFVSVSGMNRLVLGQRSKPLRVVADGRERLVKDSLVGSFLSADVPTLRGLLAARRIVCLTPPIRDAGSEEFLNIDADLLAASLATALQAQHMRFVTGTPGILADVRIPDAPVSDVYPEDELPFVSGRMKQKVRAARLATSSGFADCAILGPHCLSVSDRRTWFWPTKEPGRELSLLTKAVSIVSVSGDELELARFIESHARSCGLDAHIDMAGNFVARKGNGPRRLMLLGHMDTVPFSWPVRWLPAGLSGRGSVDAKPSLVNFIEAAVQAQVPEWASLIVVGATEEEVSSSRGAFFVRDHYAADAVIIGEPSGAEALTLGYFGLFKLRVSACRAVGHSAGKSVISAADLLLQTLGMLRERLAQRDPAGLSSLLEVSTAVDRDSTYATCVVNVRVSPEARLQELTETVSECATDGIAIEVLRATPGAQSSRGSTLARAFARSFASAQVNPRYLVKKGTSDMNTLATTWKDVPMVAYGPGDSALDHTPYEIMPSQEFLKARAILDGAIAQWFKLSERTDVSN